MYGACAHVCPRVDVCEVGTKFNDTEISQPGLAIRLAPNIDSFNPVVIISSDLYGYVKVKE